MIISASRRTDIPAFYTPWFLNRIRAGFLLTRNPFNYHQVKRVSLNPADVDAIVFWTRNPRMLIHHLPELDSYGYDYYFQYTITGYPAIIEPSAPRPHRAIECFKILSDMIGAERVIWRYDPVLVSNLVDINEHKRLFSKIASLIWGKTKKVVISFADFYKKTERNLSVVPAFKYYDIIDNPVALHDLVTWMSYVAGENGMEIECCSEKINLNAFGVKHGKCIDGGLIQKLSGTQMNPSRDPGQREACGCMRSIDIGAYNTCLHGCAYCYATFNGESVHKNKQNHHPESPLLIGTAADIDKNLLLPSLYQESLF
ncbi:DUF1848 domain-containing protein [Salmonella enterica]|nr:DUF1848 domain-containing protein [Salmonella enterica]